MQTLKKKIPKSFQLGVNAGLTIVRDWAEMNLKIEGEILKDIKEICEPINEKEMKKNWIINEFLKDI